MKRRLFLALLIVSLFSAVVGLPAAFGQACSTPPPTYTPTPGYRATVQAVSPGNLVVYFPLNETSGTAAEDDSGNNADATYHGVTLNSTTFLTGDPAGSWDGVNDNVDMYTAHYAANVNEQEGSAMVWVYPAAWTNSILQVILAMSADTNNRNLIRKSAGNQLQFRYVAGGVTRDVLVTVTPTGWMQILFTWTLSGNLTRGYHAGIQDGSMTTLGTFVGALDPTTNTIGAGSTSGTSPFAGNIAQVAIWKNTILNATQAAMLATIDPTQIVPPTATLCPTYTPTPSPTWTPTYTPTPTNTPNLYHFFTIPAPIGTPLPDATGTATPAPGQDVVFVSEMNAGQVGISFLLAAIFFSLLIMWLVVLLMRRKAPKQPKPVITTNQSE
jgi:hypothetical protein